MSYETYRPWSYQVLCSDEAMKVYYELCCGKDIADGIEKKLNKILLGKKASSDFDDCISGMVAAALVGYAETNVNCYNLLDLDLDIPKDKKEFYDKYDPLLDMVFHTDLKYLKDKAIKVLNMMHNTELGEWWYEEDTYLEWCENIDDMVYELKGKKHIIYGSYKPRSYQVLCSNEAMKVYRELCRGKDIAGGIEKKLNKILLGNKASSDFDDCIAGLVAAALVGYAEANVNCYNLLDLDLDIPEDNKEFYDKYDPLLDKVYQTDLDHLRSKAIKVLKMMENTELGKWWYEEDTYSEWMENIEDMINELKN